MSKPVCCPQCQAPLKIPPGLAADKAITCPSCRLKFVPPATNDATSASPSRVGLIMVVLGIVVLAGTIAAWNLIGGANREIAANTGSTTASGNSGQADKTSTTLTP